MTLPPSDTPLPDAAPAPASALDRLRAAAQATDDAAAFAALLDLKEQERAGAAPLALQLGQPRQAAQWAAEPLTRAAAWLRLGEAAQASQTLSALPDSARVAALRARAAWQLGEQDAATLAEHARALARQEGDVPALVAAVTLLAETQLFGTQAPQALTALRTLAEGLKVAELTGQSADAHLLAVLAHVQRRVGSAAKAGRTAHRALERSLPRSPARVLALLALGRPAEAQAEALAGQLGEVWWREFSAALTPSSPEEKAGTAADE